MTDPQPQPQRLDLTMPPPDVLPIGKPITVPAAIAALLAARTTAPPP